MDAFTIYCTPEQTKKALELGAPIQFASINDIKLGIYIEVENNNKVYKIPTTEQMIGWLEYQNSIHNISITTYGFMVWTSDIDYITEEHITRTRKEATHAAIDAALDYLIKNSK